MFKVEKIQFNKVEVHLLYYSDFDVKEHFHNLLPHEKETLESFSSENRRMEYVATRVLRTMTFGNEQILYSEIGAPYIISEGFVSISHAYNVVGLAFCQDFQVGLDLEPIREKVLSVKHKFLSKDETRDLDINDVTEMTKVWSGKEALYKLAGRKGIIFAKELLLTKDKTYADLWHGAIINGNKEKTVTLSITQRDNFVISVNIEAPKDE